MLPSVLTVRDHGDLRRPARALPEADRFLDVQQPDADGFAVARIAS